MKRIYTLAVLCFGLFGASAQPIPAFNWANAIGDTSEQVAVKFVTDEHGNFYVCGHMTGTTDFDPGPGTANLTSYGDSDIFVAKYERSGALMWNFNIGGTGPDEALDIVLHKDLLYITGYFSGSNVEFDPILTGTLLSSNGGKDIFIANYDTTGFLLFAHGLGAGSTDIANSIAIDDSANIAIAGSFSLNVDFDPGVGTTTLQTGGVSSDAFVAKYDSLGRFRWAIDFGSGTLGDQGTDVAMDDSGNVFTTGIFQQTNIDFDPSANTAYLTSAGGYDGYLASYTRDGNYRWAFNIGGSTGDRINAVAVDTANEVLITGRFSGNGVDFDPGSSYWPHHSPSSNDVFVAKYTTNGNYLWAFPIGSSGGNDEGMEIIASTYSNYVIATGTFAGTADFEPSSQISNLTAAGNDVFVAAYEPNGAYAWAFKIGGPGADVGTALTTYLFGDDILLYVGGFFGPDSADFNPNVPVNYVSSHGNHDVFVAQYIDPFPVGIPTVSAPANEVFAYPNPAGNLLNVRFHSPIVKGQLVLSDMQGKIVRQMAVDGTSATIHVSDLDAGIYMMSVTDEKGAVYSRISVAR